MVRIIVLSCSLMSHVHSIFSCSTFVMKLPSLHTAASKGRIATTSRSVRLDWCAHCFLTTVPYFYSLLLNLALYTYSILTVHGTADNMRDVQKLQQVTGAENHQLPGGQVVQLPSKSPPAHCSGLAIGLVDAYRA